MRISARNQLKGTIVDVVKGATTSHVRIDAGGGIIMTASITNEAVDDLKLAKGQPAIAVIKATDVMVAIRHPCSAVAHHRTDRLLGTRVVESVADIVKAHRTGQRKPEEAIAGCFARIGAYGDPAAFITLRDQAEALAEAQALAAQDAADLLLYGVPIAVKDNIDVAGLPTTAGCPSFSYAPSEDATAVARARAAGAIVIGKDQSRSVRNRACRRPPRWMRLPPSIDWRSCAALPNPFGAVSI